MIWEQILHEDVIAMSIPIVAIITLGAVSALKQIHRHRERLAMIEQGMDPDAPKGQRGLGHGINQG